MDENEAYERLTMRSERLVKLVRLKSPIEAIFNEIKILYKNMPEFEEAYTKWSTMQTKEAIGRCRNRQGLCAKCPEQLDYSDVLGLCKVCIKPYEM